MPLIFLGKTACEICAQIIDDAEDITTIYPFILNRKDPLYIFNNEAVLHKHCFNKLEEKDKLENLLKIRKNNLKFPPICNICNEKIINPDDYVLAECFTSNELDKLYKYNFMQFHRACLDNSGYKNKINNLIKKRIKNKEWIYSSYIKSEF